jgi:hypothetical protein
VIQEKPEEVFDLQAAMCFAQIAATRRINRVLSPEQLKRWRSIQAAARGK